MLLFGGGIFGFWSDGGGTWAVAVADRAAAKGGLVCGVGRGGGCRTGLPFGPKVSTQFGDLRRGLLPFFGHLRQPCRYQNHHIVQLHEDQWCLHHILRARGLSSRGVQCQVPRVLVHRRSLSVVWCGT